MWDSPSSYMLGLCPFLTLCHVTSSMYFIPSQFTLTQVPCSFTTRITHNLNCLSGSVLMHSSLLQIILCFLPLLQSHSSQIVLHTHYAFSSLMTSIFDLKDCYLLQDCHWTYYPYIQQVFIFSYL